MGRRLQFYVGAGDVVIKATDREEILSSPPAPEPPSSEDSAGEGTSKEPQHVEDEVI